MPSQDQWRFCQKCYSLFFDGYYPNSRCAAGGGPHSAAGYNFLLPHDVPGTLTDQTDWDFCVKCHVMFYNGYPDKGRCPAGDGHERHPDAYRFVLPHNVPGTPIAQSGWEFCVKCFGMFYNDYPDKGRCEAGGGHEHHPEAYRFVLPHPLFRQFVRLHETPDFSGVRVNGSGFTPDHPDSVKIAYGYQRSGMDGVTHHTFGELIASTDNNGDFDAGEFDVPNNTFNISARAVDGVTQQFANSNVLRPTI